MSDEFWNTSSTSRFNFDDDDDDDDDDDEQEETSKDSSLFTLLPTQKEESTLPIHSIISRRNLDLILEDNNSHNQYICAPVEEIRKKMFCGRKYVLNYRNLEDKINLLDSVVETMDGNAITAVIVYLSKTLARSVFLQLLLKREIALKHYASYLIFNNRIRDLLDFYMATGVHSSIRISCFLILKNLVNKENLLGRLEQYIDNFHYSKDMQNDFIEFKTFLNWQINNKQEASSPTEQLARLFKNVPTEVPNFQQVMKISGFQYEWIHVNTLASKQEWKQIKDVYITENWFVKKRTFKSVIRPEIFVRALHRHNAPRELLEEFLSSFSSMERSLEIAKQINFYKFVIDYHFSQRDRLALVEYKNCIPNKSQEYLYLESILISSDKKWKN